MQRRSSQRRLQQHCGGARRVRAAPVTLEPWTFTTSAGPARMQHTATCMAAAQTARAQHATRPAAAAAAHQQRNVLPARCLSALTHQHRQVEGFHAAAVVKEVHRRVYMRPCVRVQAQMALVALVAL